MLLIGERRRMVERRRSVQDSSRLRPAAAAVRQGPLLASVEAEVGRRGRRRTVDFGRQVEVALSAMVRRKLLVCIHP